MKTRSQKSQPFFAVTIKIKAKLTVLSLDSQDLIILLNFRKIVLLGLLMKVSFPSQSENFKFVNFKKRHAMVVDRSTLCSMLISNLKEL